MNQTRQADLPDLAQQQASEETAVFDQRLTDLEIKASFGEDAIDRLNDVIVRQQQQIEELSRAVAALHQQVEQMPAAGLRSLRDELPPHF